MRLRPFSKDVHRYNEYRWIRWIAQHPDEANERGGPWQTDETQVQELALMYVTHLSDPLRKSILKSPQEFEDNVERYALAEWQSLWAIAHSGHAAVRDLTVSFFRELDDESINSARQTLMQSSTFEKYQRLDNGRTLDLTDPLVTPDHVRAFATVGFSSLSEREQRAIVFESSASFPSPRWWEEVAVPLVQRGFYETFREVIAETERLTQLPVPSPRTEPFQRFVADMLACKATMRSKYTLYPRYVRGMAQGLRVDVPPAKELIDRSKTATKAVNGCTTRETGRFQPHQSLVAAMLQLKADGRIGDELPGLLAVHSTGAGKTLLTLCAICAFWNDPRKALFVVSVKSNNRDNGLRILAQLGMQYMPGFVDEEESFRPFDPYSYEEFTTKIHPALIASRRAAFDRLVFTATTSNKEVVDKRTEVPAGRLPKQVYDAMFAKCIEAGADTRRMVPIVHHEGVKYAVAKKEDLKRVVITPSLEPAVQALVATTIRDRIRRGLTQLVDACATTKADAKKHKASIASNGRDLYTFETLGNDLSKGVFGSSRKVLKHAVFVVDEAHYMFTPYNRGDKLGAAYATVRDAITARRDPATTFCLAMTATPGNSREEAIGLVRLVATAKRFKVTSADDDDVFVHGARGFVSFVDLRNDRSHFADLKKTVLSSEVGHPSQSRYASLFRNALCRIEPYHPNACRGARAASDAIKNQMQWSKDNKKSFYRYLRACGNYIMKRRTPTIRGGADDERPKRTRRAPDVYKPAVGDDDDSDFEFVENSDEDDVRDGGVRAIAPGEADFVTSDGSGDYEVYVSPKIKTLMTRLLEAQPQGKHFVFTNDKATMGVIAHLLMKAGVPRLDPAVKDPNQPSGWRFQYKGVDGTVDAPPGTVPCFITLNNVTSQKTHARHLRYRNVNRDLAGEELNLRIEACKRAANASDNVQGQHVRYVLGTEESFKGVDFNHIRYLHLVDPMVEHQDGVQFEGRGVRYCSHVGWGAPSTWRVHMYAYRLTRGVEWQDVSEKLFADIAVANDALERFSREWRGTDELLRLASVDRFVFGS